MSQLRTLILLGAMCGLGGIAFADSSSTTVTGAARFGPAISFSTFSHYPGGGEYALQLSSGLYLGNGLIQFADGSEQFSAFLPVSNSTASVLPEQTSFASGLSTRDRCLVGSTVTIVMSSNESFLGVFLAGTAYGNASGATGTFNILLDGARVSDFPETSPILLELTPITGARLNFMVVLTKRQLMGTRTVCLRAFDDGITFTVQNDSDSKPLFGAFEIR